MNIDFSQRPGFSAYVLLLMAAGVAMVIIASPTVKRQRPIQRALNAVVGLAFFGYGFYLAFLFKGGSYVIFFQAFILPIVLIARTIRSAAAAPATPTAAPSPYPAAPQPQYSAPQPPASAAISQDTGDWLSTPQPTYAPPPAPQPNAATFPPAPLPPAE